MRILLESQNKKSEMTLLSERISLVATVFSISLVSIVLYLSIGTSTQQISSIPTVFHCNGNDHIHVRGNSLSECVSYFKLFLMQCDIVNGSEFWVGYLCGINAKHLENRLSVFHGVK